MTHWTPEEVRGFLRREKVRAGGWSALARKIGCNRPNLINGVEHDEPIPVAALQFLGLERVTAYVKRAQS